MSDAIQRRHPGITDEQRAKFLEIIGADKTIGIRDAMKQAGVWGTGGEMRTLFRNDPELQEDARLARGWNINRVEGVAWEVALDKEHPSWQRTAFGLLKAYGGSQFRDKTDVDVQVAGRVEVEDRSAPIDALYRVLQAVGALDSSGTPHRALPAATDVLAEPPEG